MFYGCSDDDFHVYMQGAVMIPHSFGSDFGDQIDRYAILVDKNHNEFDLRVERINLLDVTIHDSIIADNRNNICEIYCYRNKNLYVIKLRCQHIFQ